MQWYDFILGVRIGCYGTTQLVCNPALGSIEIKTTYQGNTHQQSSQTT